MLILVDLPVEKLRYAACNSKNARAYCHQKERWLWAVRSWRFSESRHWLAQLQRKRVLSRCAAVRGTAADTGFRSYPVLRTTQNCRSFQIEMSQCSDFRQTAHWLQAHKTMQTMCDLDQRQPHLQRPLENCLGTRSTEHNRPQKRLTRATGGAA